MSAEKEYKDPMIFGNAMMEYKNGKPVNMRVSRFKPGYAPNFEDLSLSCNENGKPLFELEDE